MVKQLVLSLSFFVTKDVFLSVNPKTDFRSKNGFHVPFGKSKSGFLIWWILFEKGFIGFEIRRIQIQINGLVIYAAPFTVDPKLVRWSSGISSWSIPIEALRVSSLLSFAAKHLETLEDCSWYIKISIY